MRVGDTTYGGSNIPYKGIVGKQYKAGTKIPIDGDANKYNGDFEAVDALYEKLESEYNMASGAKVFIKKTKDELERYYVPILALPRMSDIKVLEKPPITYSFKEGATFGDVLTSAVLGAGISGILLDMNNEKYFVKLELRLTITKSPKKLYWELPEKYSKSTSKLVKGKPIEIKCPELPVAVCKDKKIEFEIGCNITIPETIDIKLMALAHNGTSRMVGIFRIWRNISKRKKILLVQVISNLGKGVNMFPNSKLKSEAKLIKKYLSQSLIIPDIEIIKDFNMTDTGWFSNKNLNAYKTSGGKLLVSNEYKKEYNLYAHLHKYLTEGYKISDDTIVLYFIKEDTQKLLKRGGKAIYEGFYAANLMNTNLIMISDVQKEKDFASSHEIIHALKILHSFTNSEGAKDGNIAMYTYQAKKTDNIMDYAQFQFSLWHWQWKKMHK